MAEQGTVEIIPQPGPQRMFAQATQTIVFYGGSVGGGKTWSILAESLKYIHDPDYFAVYFRKTVNQLEQALWKDAKKMYMPFLIYQDGPKKGKFVGKAKIQNSQKTIVFPSGAIIKFSYLDQEEDAEYNWQGTQLSAVFFDEFTHFKPFHFSYLRSRLRSDAEVGSFVRASMNPDPEHFVLEWIEPYLDPDGYPDKSLSGKSRYFLYDLAGNLHTSWDEEDLADIESDGEPDTYTFIAASLDDNPMMLKKNPKYKSTVAASTAAQREALLKGNWKYTEQESSYFSREWLHKIDALPLGCQSWRGWDKASSEVSEKNRYPDFTASVKISKDSHGYFYITGDFHPDCKDKGSEILGRFRKRPGDRDILISLQANKDSNECKVVLPQDPGGGIAEYISAAKALGEEGFIVDKDPVPSNKTKLFKYTPFSSACQNGLVSIVESSFPNKATLEAFYRENEVFNGEESTGLRKDDWPDACAAAFNAANQGKVFVSLTRNQTQHSTLAREVLEKRTSERV